jgi:hypothetical protein
VVQCCILKPIPQVLIKTSGSMLCTEAYSSGINKRSGSMLCTEAYTLVTNGDKSGSVLLTINLNVCTNTNKGDHVYEEMSLKKSAFSEHKTLLSTNLVLISQTNQFTGYF